MEPREGNKNYNTLMRIFKEIETCVATEYPDGTMSDGLVFKDDLDYDRFETLQHDMLNSMEKIDKDVREMYYLIFEQGDDIESDPKGEHKSEILERLNMLR